LTTGVRAIRQHPPGGVSSLVYEELQEPRPGAGEAVVRVHAAAITRDELDWTKERLPVTPSFEASGVVAEVALDVVDVAIGDEVYAYLDHEREGAAAELAVIRAERLAPKPTSVSHVEAAAIPLSALSAWQGLFDHGGLTAGQRVLIHGAAGGVGHFAIQLARWRGAHIVATASTANVEAARELGADEVVDHAAARFEDVVAPVDLVFDTAGGERLERSPAVVRPGGRLVSVAEEPPTAPGISSVYFVVEPSREQLIEIGRLVDAGELRPAIDEVFPLTEAREAFERSLGDHRRGKIVLRVTG
jgi:NADPH:quinone reductase-like Zn-dependent oxidoreductase